MLGTRHYVVEIRDDPSSLHEIPVFCAEAHASALMEEPAQNIALQYPTHTALSFSIHRHYGSIQNACRIIHVAYNSFEDIQFDRSNNAAS